jgi:hypothetical protein
MLSDITQRYGHNDTQFLSELFEETGWTPNGHLMLVRPEDVGALTDSPLVTDDMTHEEDGSVKVYGAVWWFPEYELVNLADKLRKNGAVTLTLAP